MYSIRLAEEKDIPALQKFFNEVYAPDHIMTDKKYLDWQYLNAPGNTLYPKYSNLLLFNGEEIIGHVGMIPYEFSTKGRIQNGAFLASLIVKKEYEAHGAGVMLLRESEKYFDVVYATGVNEKALPATTMCGWSESQNLTRFIYQSTPRSGLGIRRPDLAEEEHIKQLEHFDPSWDTAWSELRGRYEATINRSSKYLNWRFFENPTLTYTIFGIFKSNELKGYIVLRFEKGEEYQACRIVDLVAEANDGELLLKKAIQFSEERKVNFTDFFSTSSFYDRALKENGFYKYDPDKNGEPPVFILPPDRRRRRLAINFVYKCVKDCENKKEGEWFVVKADGDKDRANRAEY